jgi:hypothetical protein
MQAWMQANKKVVGPLHLSRFADEIYFLLRPIMWEPNPGQDSYASITVPTGFVTDLASIPQIFWSALRPDGRYTYPAIVHDYLYWTQTAPKDVADNIFRFGMEDLRVDRPTVFAIYNAVHLLGAEAWRSNASAKAAGERRVLAKFPEDPTVTWQEWKLKPGVFAD